MTQNQAKRDANDQGKTKTDEYTPQAHQHVIPNLNLAKHLKQRAKGWPRSEPLCEATFSGYKRNRHQPPNGNQQGHTSEAKRGGVVSDEGRFSCCGDGCRR